MSNQPRMVPKIWLPYGVGKKLQEHMGCSKESVRRALGYLDPNNETHNRIRKEALENYGGIKMMVPVKY